MNELSVRIGQVWGDGHPDHGFGRELIVKNVDDRYAHCIDTNGRRTRILLRRMRPRKGGYYLRTESEARYVAVPSQEGLCMCSHVINRHEPFCKSCPGKSCPIFQAKKVYQVWTGDLLSPAHCPCENFHWAPRVAGEPYYCKHLKFVLLGKGIS